MSKLIFLDLETSGLEEKDRICELAFICEEDEDLYSSTSLCKPPKKISNGAMEIHHISNEMIKEALPCTQTAAFKDFVSLNIAENILIAHNIRFDLQLLEREGFNNKMQVIDTLRCVKSLIPECEEFRLQFLRYELNLYKQEHKEAELLGVKLEAHRALSDALHLRLLFKTLLDYATLSQLIDISSKPVLLEKFSFGKYKGRYIEEIVNLDAAYIQWMLGSIEDMDEDLNYSLKYYKGFL